MRDSITNYTANGVCSNCHECCTDILWLTKYEMLRIREYINKHGVVPKARVKATFPEVVIDLRCCFIDDEKNTCMIYPVRPFSCRKFQCNLSRRRIEDIKNVAERRKDVSLLSMTGTYTSDPYFLEFYLRDPAYSQMVKVARFEDE